MKLKTTIILVMIVSMICALMPIIFTLENFQIIEFKIIYAHISNAVSFLFYISIALFFYTLYKKQK